MDVIDKIKLKGDEHKNLEKASKKIGANALKACKGSTRILQKLHKGLAKTAQDDWRKLAISWIKSNEN
jgi:hypothetical protein